VFTSNDPQQPGKHEGPGPVTVGTRQRLTGHYGPAINEWLNSVPEAVADAAAQWGLTVTGYHDAGCASVIVLASDGDHVSHVIKAWYDPDRYRHELWNASSPWLMATDLGSGLERLRWAITRSAWPLVVHGSLTERADPAVLDSIRAATLIAANGIQPSDRGPGSALRRLARSIPAASAGLGLSGAVRSAYAYWSLTCPPQLPWPDVCQSQASWQAIPANDGSTAAASMPCPPRLPCTVTRVNLPDDAEWPRPASWPPGTRSHRSA
jgi:hypothetical protein